MSDGIEFGKCEICGKEAPLERTYFFYNIKCGCHSPQHFELVIHCADCIPKMPSIIHPMIKAMDGKEYRTTIVNILPIDISGAYIIDKPIIQEPRWRATVGGEYFYIGENFVVQRCFDFRHEYDNVKYKCGNYFRTEKDAAKGLNRLLNNREEND